jgi:phytoene/squalene synthetase
MKGLFDKTSAECSKLVTNKYSTSFSLGIRFLAKKFHGPIYNIYGFVRCADEIVDSFHDYDKKSLLAKYKADTFEAIQQKISVNPILNSFQETVNQYNIDHELILLFFKSMEMDLEKQEFNQEKYNDYILGSAEAVGLMCLRVFAENKDDVYNDLVKYAMKLGSAFQKVNFLRDLRSDINDLGRFYFPGGTGFTKERKAEIEKEIEDEFKYSLIGIRKLPSGARSGVYLAYSYYYNLFEKIKRYPPSKVLAERIRIPNSKKFSLMFNSLLKEKFNFI